jgi:hypothetical protein
MTDERQLHLLSSYRLATSYPLQQTPDEVAAWLNGYAALWHPAALAGAAQAPQASSSYDHDYPRTGFVYCVPDGAHLFQPDNWPARVEEAKAIVFRAKPSRAETVERLIEGPSRGRAGRAVARRARGCDRRVRRPRLRLPDARHAVRGDGPRETARRPRLLGRRRRRPRRARARRRLPFAPEGRGGEAAGRARAGVQRVDPLARLGHLDPKNLGAPWPGSLAAGLPLTVLASGETLEQLAEQAPERFEELKAKLPRDLPHAVDLCCGSFRDREDALMPVESQLWNLRAARRRRRRCSGWGRRCTGGRSRRSTRSLPGWLLHAGFKHAVLTSSDGA